MQPASDMNEQVIELGAFEEAKRLWDAATSLRGDSGNDIVALLEAVDLGLRAVEILAVERLHDIRGDFPATIAALLDRPTREVDVQRDAVHVPATVGFTEIVDLLSAAEAECVAPGMHRGWEDRRFSCRRSRDTAQKAVGYTIPVEDAGALVLLSAYRNRVFRLPPPVLVNRGEVKAGFPPLERLYGALSADG